MRKPSVSKSPEASALAAISARLPYTFMASRFAHYFKAIARDRIGWPTTGPQGVAADLNAWVQRYVGPPAAAGERAMEWPLADARVEVEEVVCKSGSYRAVVWLRPRVQFEELTASLREVVELPPRPSDQPTSSGDRATNTAAHRGQPPNWPESMAQPGANLEATETPAALPVGSHERGEEASAGVAVRTERLNRDAGLFECPKEPARRHPLCHARERSNKLPQRYRFLKVR